MGTKYISDLGFGKATSCAKKWSSIRDCYITILYIMYTKLSIQEDLSLKYLNTKFGKCLIQNSCVATLYV